MTESVVVNEPLVAEAPVVEAPVAPAEVVVTDGQNTGESAPPAKSEGEKPAELTPEQEAKREQRRAQNKLEKAFRQKAEWKARAEHFERLANEAKPQQPQQDAGEPRMEQFDDIEKYAEAKAAYREAKVLKENEAKQRQQVQQSYVENVRESWETKASKADSKYEDFDEVVGDFKPDSPWGFAMAEADNGIDIAYYLAKHPDEAKKINSLHPLAQARAIGKLEAKLQAEPVVPKTPSNAPAPIKPLGSSNSPSTKKLTEMSQDEFEKRRKATIAARR